MACAAVIHFACAALAPAQTVRYRVTLVPDLPGGEVSNRAWDINERGQVCGMGLAAGGTIGQVTGYRWDPATDDLIAIWGLVPDGQTSAVAMNDGGAVVGGTQHPNTLNNQAILWRPETGAVALSHNPAGYFSSDARGVNNRLEVSGSGVTGGVPHRNIGFLWDEANGMREIGDLPGGETLSVASAINDSTAITGWSGSLFGYEAFFWTPDDGMIGLGDLVPDSYANSGGDDINSANQVVGTARSLSSPLQEAFLWDPQAGMIGLGHLYECCSSFAQGMNERGQVVGYTRDAAENPEAIIWDAEHGMRALDDLLDHCGPPTPQHFTYVAWAINNAGQIACDLYSGRGAVLTPYLLGDLDANRAVNLADLNTLLAHFGSGDADYEQGDLDCDRDVDLRDLAVLLSNFGMSLP